MALIRGDKGNVMCERERGDTMREKERKGGGEVEWVGKEVKGESGKDNEIPIIRSVWEIN